MLLYTLLAEEEEPLSDPASKPTGQSHQTLSFRIDGKQPDDTVDADQDRMHVKVIVAMKGGIHHGKDKSKALFFPHDLFGSDNQ